MLSNAEPLLSVLMAAVILGQWLSPVQWIGAAIMIGAIVLFEAAGRHEAGRKDARARKSALLEFARLPPSS